jgi:glutathione S-transferase
MNDTPYRLYGRSNAGSLAVQVAFEELGAPYSIEWIPKEPAAVENYRRVNPEGRVPALVLPDGTLLTESAAILIHLAGTEAGRRLAPAPGTSAHALFLKWVVSLSANLYETALRYYYPDRYSTAAADAPRIQAQAAKDYERHLGAAAAAVKPYLLGDTYSAADPYLYMLLGWYPGDMAALLARYPALKRHQELVKSRPAVVKADADHAER